MEDRDFEMLGLHAAAGREATRLALEAGAASSAAGRIPISGAAVARRDNGSLDVICVGVNGRIPAGAGAGCPTDHGETGAIRQISDVSAVDWDNVVFATTLSPCIMCTRTLIHLHGLGLRRIVVAESQSFAGRMDLLRDLPDMEIVELRHPPAVEMMQRFARTYPWDWAADIGAVPPAHPPRPIDVDAALAVLRSAGADAGVFRGTGAMIAHATDGRATSGGNPVHAAAMLAIGRAGSAINLREHFVVVDSDEPLDRATFGESALGACELFRPAAVAAGGFASDLADALAAAGVPTLSRRRHSPQWPGSSGPT
ncbi:MAG: hypothetical protein VX265_14620 [Myxococcota bacterium]|nr:hypothetical protein [Myxococcota bacterium]